MTLRQEVYELDVDRAGAQRRRTCRCGCSPPPRTTATSAACSRAATNRHAVFLVTESEALTYHYELDLRPSPARTPLEPDPRIAHTLNLSFDELGNVQQSVAVGYRRARAHQDDPALDAEQLGLIRDVQRERHVAYTETRYTDDVAANRSQAAPTDVLPAARAVRGADVRADRDRAGGEAAYFDLADLRGYRLSDARSPARALRPSSRKPYHEQPRRRAARSGWSSTRARCSSTRRPRAGRAARSARSAGSA